MNPELLRRLPKMDLLLARPALAEHPLPYPVKRQAARQVLDDCRRALREGALASVPGPAEGRVRTTTCVPTGRETPSAASTGSSPPSGTSWW